MNPQAINNRILAGAVTALLGPWWESKTGMKLSDEQVIAMVALAPVAYHMVAGAWAKCVAAFVLYFPPPSPNAPGPTAPKA
jgi:hypothetical protein